MMSARDNRVWGDGPEQPHDAVPTARLGADLRAARERLGWTLPAIAAHLRIRLPFLEAIEQGRTDDLPGSAYAVGFIRTYAQALGLDPDEIARRFRTEAGEASRRMELDFPAPMPERSVPVLAVMLVCGVLIVGAYAAWYRLSGNRHPAADVVQTVPARLLPLLADKPPAPVAPAPLPTPSATAAAAPPAAPAAPQVAAIEAPPSVSPASAAAATAEPAPILPPADAAAPGLDTPRGVVLRATADAWMQVRDRISGQVLLNRVLRAGEIWPVPSERPGLLLTTGNAGGTEMVVDGVASAPLGGDGAVRRDLPIGAGGGEAARPTAISAAHRIVLPHNQ